MEDGISTLFDLYKRLTPCLNTKVRELRRSKFDLVKKEDIWNYFVKEKWKKEKGLTLDMMVDDILNIDNEILYNYTKNYLEKVNREASLDEVEIIL